MEKKKNTTPKKKSTSTKKSETVKTKVKKTTAVKKVAPKKTSTRKKKQSGKRAFTLIELLAVIIILGILMLVAIPSVTTYINNSRKDTYVVNAKSVVQGARNKVNSGELQVYDENVTYYIPYEIIPLENKASSPYGDYTKAYVVATYDNNSYDYYWTSSDTNKMGIYLTYSDNLTAKDVLSGVDAIEPNIAICGKETIIVFDANGFPGEPTTAEDCVSARANYDPKTVNSTDYLSGGTDNDTEIFGRAISKNDFESIKVEKTKDVPADAIDSWDVSPEHNGTVMAWYTDANNNNKFELHVGQDGGVIAAADSSHLFAWYRNVKEVDVTNLKINKVRNMTGLFHMTGYTPSSFKITGLENWDVSKVTDMTSMFYGAGHNASSWNIGDLSKWNTKNVTSMRYMFTSVGWNVRNFNLSFISKWNVSNVQDMGNMLSGSGYYSDTWTVGDLSNWDTKKCKKMNQIFQNAGVYDAYVHSIGTLNIYADDLQYAFSGFHSSGTINIHKKIWANPGWLGTFANSGGYTVNYTSESESQIDSIIASQGYHGRVVKGTKLY